MSPQRLRIFALVAAVLIVVVGFWASYHDVLLVLNGADRLVSVRALTVGGALKELGIDIQSDDALQPGRFAILQDGSQIVLNRAMRYQIWADGLRLNLQSSERDPLLVLAEADLVLENNDRLLVDGRTHAALEPLPFASQLNIEIIRAKAITLLDDGQAKPVLSSANSVSELLAENGILLYEGDEVEPKLESTLGSVNRIVIRRAKQLEISVGDKLIEVRSTAEGVGKALADAGISLQGLDRSKPRASAAIPDDGVIEVIRVEERVEMSTNIIPFTVEWQGDPNTEIDERSVIQPGQNGVQATSERVIYENGEEVSREYEGQWVLSEPVTQISGFGTKIVVRTAVVDGVTIEYWRTLELFATSYSPCRSGTSSCYYYTALGDEVKQGIAAVYLSWWYAMGQHTVYVPGYGHAKISDNGAYPDGRPWIDLGYSDEDWVSWAQWVTVYFTTPVPPESEILYLLP